MSWKLTLDELVKATEGHYAFPPPPGSKTEFSGIGTDTRADLSGKVFVALKGENFDAHDFLRQAVQAGASALLVHRLPEGARDAVARIPVIEVRDSLKSFQLLANFWRHKIHPLVIGITGTNGKTTTKEFAAALIGSKKSVQYSKGSFNNHWGVPMSLLSLDSSHEVALVEMGMNHPGELADLDQITEPDVVLCTMVGRGHLEGLGSIEGVAKAKAEIYEYAPAHAVKIFNLENAQTRRMFETMSPGLPPSRLMTFAGRHFEASTTTWPQLDVSMEVVEVRPDSLRIRGEIQGVKGETEIGVFGKQNLVNLMAASCCALASGLTPSEVWEALPLCKTAWGRNQWVNTEKGARVLFDAYNANPESMRAALENFAAIRAPEGGRKFAVLGEMRELGSHASELHHEIGRVASHSGFDHISFFGPSAAQFEAGLKAAGFDKILFISSGYEQKLAHLTLPVLNDKDIVLIKGSRGMKLENVLADLRPLDFQGKN